MYVLLYPYLNGRFSATASAILNIITIPGLSLYIASLILFAFPLHSTLPFQISCLARILEFNTEILIAQSSLDKTGHLFYKNRWVCVT